jgi:hypothetical protein
MHSIPPRGGKIPAATAGLRLPVNERLGGEENEVRRSYEVERRILVGEEVYNFGRVREGRSESKVAGYFFNEDRADSTGPSFFKILQNQLSIVGITLMRKKVPQAAPQGTV